MRATLCLAAALVVLAAAGALGAPNDGGAGSSSAPARKDAQGRAIVDPPHVVISDWPQHVIPIANSNARPSRFPEGQNVFSPLRAMEILPTASSSLGSMTADSSAVEQKGVTPAKDQGTDSVPGLQSSSSSAPVMQDSAGAPSKSGGELHDTIVVDNGNHVDDLRRVPSLLEEQAGYKGEKKTHETVVVSNGNKVTDVRRANAFVELAERVNEARKKPSHDTIVLSNHNRVTQIHRIHYPKVKKTSESSQQSGSKPASLLETEADKKPSHDTIVLSNHNRVTQIHRIHYPKVKKTSESSQQQSK